MRRRWAPHPRRTWKIAACETMTFGAHASPRSIVLCAKHGGEVPYTNGLDEGFPFRGRRVPFLSRYKGIHRAAAQRGTAALSINTSHASPCEDEETPDGTLYAYRAGSPDQPDNRALRAAYELQVPLAYFVGTRSGWYQPLYPCFVAHDDPVGRRVLVTPGRMAGPLEEREAWLPEGPLERRYRVSVARGLLEDEDGPMLELLKRFDRQEILVPASVRARPDRDRLASRFERFRDRAS